MSLAQEPPSPVLQRPLLILLGMVALAYFPFAFAELFWDDYLVIRPDGPIAEIGTVVKAFFGRCVLFSEEYSYPYYRPLIDALFVLEYAVAGTHPFLYHLTNFVLHAASTVMAYLLILRLVGDRPGATLAAFAGTAVFALHPIQVESVLWPAARPAVLGLFFLLGAVHCGIRSVEAPAPGRGVLLGIAALVLFVASLFSKEIAIAAPPCIVLLLLTPAGRSTKSVVLIGASLVILAVYLVMNAAIGGSASKIGEIGFGGLLVAAVRMLGFYACQLSLPVSLFPCYPRGATDGALFLTLGLVMTAVGFVIAGWALWRRTPFALVVWAATAFFLGGAALPVLGGQLLAADRYVYQAMLGLGILVAAAMARWPGWMRRVPPLVVVIALPLLMTGLSLRQSLTWLNAASVWTWAVEKDPDNLTANYALAQLLEDAGRPAEAIALYRTAALETTPADGEYHFYAALAYGRMSFFAGDSATAFTALAQAQENPLVAPSATVWQAIVHLQSGDRAASRAALGRFTDTGREKAETYLNLARLELALSGNREFVASWYEKARQRGAGPNAEIESLLNTTP